MTPSRSSCRYVKAYREQCFEALIDSRLPRSPHYGRRFFDIIQSARLANPKITLEEMVAILVDRKVGGLPREATIKREFHKADQRRRYAEKKKDREEKIEGRDKASPARSGFREHQDGS